MNLAQIVDTMAQEGEHPHCKSSIETWPMPLSPLWHRNKLSYEELGPRNIEFFCIANDALSHATQS